MIELETKLEDYQDTEKMMRETLVNVHEVKKQSEESSKKQADLIVKEAELKSLEILENARKQARQMREEISWLKSQKESFINRLRHILLSQVELLSVLEIDDVVPEEMKKVLKSAKTRRQSALQSSHQPEQVEETEEIEMVQHEIISEEEPSIKLEETVEDVSENIDEIDPQNTEDTSPKKKSIEGEQKLSDDDINEFFKKGIQIDELINTLHKKGKKK